MIVQVDKYIDLIMFSALDSQTIAKMDEKYLEQIATLGSSEFCDQKMYNKKIHLQDMLYLTMRFCEGVLTCMPYHGGPIDDDHAESCDTLAALNREGVLTFEGQLSTNDLPYRQRSYLIFQIAFDAKQKNDMIELLETLHRKGLNVWASLFGRTKHSRQNQYITLFKSPKSYLTREYDMYDLNAPNLPDYNHNLMESDSYMVTDQYTSCFPKSVYHELMVDLIIPHQYRINVCVFNIEWDMLQADEIILESVRELKQRK